MNRLMKLKRVRSRWKEPSKHLCLASRGGGISDRTLFGVGRQTHHRFSAISAGTVKNASKRSCSLPRGAFQGPEEFSFCFDLMRFTGKKERLRTDASWCSFRSLVQLVG